MVVLTGYDAKKKLDLLLYDEEARRHPENREVVGVYEDGECKKWVAFDNVNGCCFVENFKSLEAALAYIFQYAPFKVY